VDLGSAMSLLCASLYAAREELGRVPAAVKQVVKYYQLRDLVEMAETGRLRPAAFSRQQAWLPGQVVDLFDSIIHGYPIGVFFAIQEPAPEESVVFGNVVINAPSDRGALVIIDGLQRITALIGTLSGEQSTGKDERSDLFYDIERRELGVGRATRESMLPVRTAFNSSALTNWISEHPFLSESATDTCWRLSEALIEYAVPIIILDGAQARNTGPQIFARINSTGASLTKSEITRATMPKRSDAAGLGLERLQDEVERAGFGRMSAGLAAECSLAAAEVSDEIISRTSTRQRPHQLFEQLPSSLRRDAVDRARALMIPAVQFLLLDAAIPHIRILPRPATLPILIRYVGTHGWPAGRAGELIKRWIWRSSTVSSWNTRLQLSALDTQGDALISATSLIDSLPANPGPRWRPDITASRLTRVDGRLNTLALLSLRPHLLVPAVDLTEPADVPIQATHIFASWLDEAPSAFTPLLPRSFTESRSASLAGYLLHPPAEQAQLLEAVTTMRSAQADALAGHCIDADALRLLQRREFDQFVEHRERQLTAAILRRVQSMARWGFRDHGSLPELSDGSKDAD
jgi:hypothetical protein